MCKTCVQDDDELDWDDADYLQEDAPYPVDPVA
jgi:hypothetical protein